MEVYVESAFFLEARIWYVQEPVVKQVCFIISYWTLINCIKLAVEVVLSYVHRLHLLPMQVRQKLSRQAHIAINHTDHLITALLRIDSVLWQVIRVCVVKVGVPLFHFCTLILEPFCRLLYTVNFYYFI